MAGNQCALIRFHLREAKPCKNVSRKNPVTLFSDEKNFYVNSVTNSRTDRYISTKGPQDVEASIKLSFRTKHPASVMVFGLVSSDGKKMPPVFIKQGLKVNTDVYLGILNNMYFRG